MLAKVIAEKGLSVFLKKLTAKREEKYANTILAKRFKDGVFRETSDFVLDFLKIYNKIPEKSRTNVIKLVFEKLNKQYNAVPKYAPSFSYTLGKIYINLPVSDRTPEITQMALNYTSNKICKQIYISIPTSQKTRELAKLALEDSYSVCGDIFLNIPQEHLSMELVKLAIENNSDVYKILPNEFRTAEMTEFTMQKPGLVMGYDLFNCIPTNQHTLEIIERSLANITSIGSDIEKICKAIDITLLEKVSDQIKKQVIQKLVFDEKLNRPLTDILKLVASTDVGYLFKCVLSLKRAKIKDIATLKAQIVELLNPLNKRSKIYQEGKRLLQAVDYCVAIQQAIETQQLLYYTYYVPEEGYEYDDDSWWDAKTKNTPIWICTQPGVPAVVGFKDATTFDRFKKEYLKLNSEQKKFVDEYMSLFSLYGYYLLEATDFRKVWTGSHDFW